MRQQQYRLCLSKLLKMGSWLMKARDGPKTKLCLPKQQRKRKLRENTDGKMHPQTHPYLFLSNIQNFHTTVSDYSTTSRVTISKTPGLPIKMPMGSKPQLRSVRLVCMPRGANAATMGPR